MPAERRLLQALGEISGRYTFHPDGAGPAAHDAFQQQIVRPLIALAANGLVQIDEASSRITIGSAEPRYAAIAMELTSAGWAALR